MALTSDELTAARSWIGSKESDAVFTERYDRLGSLDAAVLESLRHQLSKFILDRDASITLDDGTRVDRSANIQALTDLIEEFRNSGGLEVDLLLGGSTTKLVRARYR